VLGALPGRGGAQERPVPPPVRQPAPPQVDTAPPQQTPRPAPREAAPRDTTPRDTIKAEIALPERPRGPLTEGPHTRWDRDALYASGALTLAELMAFVPGVSVQSASFIAGVTATSWYGAPGRVRVFVDGVELDVLDSRLGGSVDLAAIPLWPMEEVVVERGAGELRIHLRSWRVQNTTPQTRTDILTGSENANLYRGFYGKRFDGGGVLQLAGQQFSTTSFRTRGDGDGLSAFARVGTPDGVADPHNGIREFIVGTGGRGHYEIGTVQPNSEVINTDTFGILKLTLHPDSYDWQFFPEAGKSFTDAGSDACH
jgi:hypothetical protein